MWFRGLRALAALSIFLCVSSSHAQNKAVVLPLSDDFVVIQLGDKDVILDDSLTNGKSSGQVTGGSFSSAGWKHFTGEDKIFWDLGQSIEAGVIEFELTGMSKNTKGGWPQPGKQRAYYFGFFNQANGNKIKGGSNPAFIEIRYNWGSSYACCSAIKFQAGDAGLAGTHHEPFGTKRWRDWNPNQYYRHKVVFGDGAYHFVYR